MNTLIVSEKSKRSWPLSIGGTLRFNHSESSDGVNGFQIQTI